MPHYFTPEQKEFIKNNVKGRSSEELHKIFNDQFELSLGINQIRAFKKNHKLSSGLDGRFKKGNVPFNKGKKGLNIGGIETRFKKGQKPHNYKPIGTERINGEGYVDIKINANKWRPKHQVIWEQHNGKIPRGHVIIFGDGNKFNFDVNNLISVSRSQLAILNTKKLIQNDADLTRTGLIIADIYHAIGQKRRGNRRSANGKTI
jgi:hypothetical protein